MQSSFGSAITQVHSGLKMLCEVSYNAKTCRYQKLALGASEVTYVSIEMLEEMFMRLDLQVSQVGLPDWENYMF
jgi:hypothetical protein